MPIKITNPDIYEGVYYGFDPDALITETPHIETFEQRLAYLVPRFFGVRCELMTEPEPSDWIQAPSEAGRWAEGNPDTFGGLHQANRPICALAPVGHHRVGATSQLGAKEAIQQARARLCVAQEQEEKRREQERLPEETRGGTWIQVGFRIHRSSPVSRRLVLSICEVYFGK
jgi:hypothetical protein